MSISPFDSGLYRELFGDPEIARLFSDTAEIRAMMLVFGVLAKAQGAQGTIPDVSAAFLHRSMLELQIDPAGLAKATGSNGVTVPGLVAALRSELQAPEHAQYLHWGATSQDIQDTALILRLRQALALIEQRLANALATLADLADAHAETPQAARTYGQSAVPSSFGALVASWGAPLMRLHDRLGPLRARVLCVSLSGAAGTASMLGTHPNTLRAAVAEGLGLRDPGESWHATRDRIGELGGWLGDLSAASGKMGTDIMLLTRSDTAELRLPGAGASSTMPQKQNPVMPSVLVALARFAPAQVAVLQGASLHAEARDGAAWFSEWLTLPPLVAAAARASAVIGDLARSLDVQTEAMAANVNDALGLIHAETLSFALAKALGRAEAQLSLKTLAREAQDTGIPLPELVARDYPDLPLPPMRGPSAIGSAPTAARRFAKAARARAAEIRAEFADKA